MKTSLSLSDIYYFFAGILEIPGRKLQKLLEHFGGAEEAYDALPNRKAEALNFIAPEVYDKAIDAAPKEKIAEHRRSVGAQNIGVLTYADELFPETLRGLQSEKAYILYYAGDPEVLSTRCFAVVGTRNHSEYGRRMTKEFAGAIAGAGFTVVSGLAIGLDAVAHRAALDAGGKTVAVIGSGLKKLSPAQNTALAREAAKNGAVVSEYSPFTQGATYTYPQRNRLISGLSEGVLLTEAHEGSGALYTADYAVEQGKSVYGVPGNADSFRSAGIFNCFRQGKMELVYKPEQILGELNAPAGRKEKGKNAILDFSSIKILDILDKGELNYDSLSVSAGISIQELSGILFGLQMKGLVEITGSVIRKI